MTDSNWLAATKDARTQLIREILDVVLEHELLTGSPPTLAQVLAKLQPARVPDALTGGHRFTTSQSCRAFRSAATVR